MNKFKKEPKEVKITHYDLRFGKLMSNSKNKVYKIDSELLTDGELRLFEKDDKQFIYVMPSGEEAVKIDFNEKYTEIETVEFVKTRHPKRYISADNVTPEILKKQRLYYIKDKESNAHLIYNLSLLFYALDGYAINYLDENLFNPINLYSLDQALKNTVLAKIEQMKKNNIALEVINAYMSEAEKDYKELYSAVELQAQSKTVMVEPTNQLLR